MASGKSARRAKYVLVRVTWRGRLTVVWTVVQLKWRMGVAS